MCIRDSRNTYRTAYGKEIRKQRLKYTLLGTGCSTVALGVYAAVVFIAFAFAPI